MKQLFAIFPPEQWVMITTAFAVSFFLTVGLVFYIRSHWWKDMVLHPVTGRVVAADFTKASCLVLGHILTIAVSFAQLVFNREAGAEVVGLIITLYSVALGGDVVKRLKNKDILAAGTPDVTVNDSNVAVHGAPAKVEPPLPETTLPHIDLEAVQAIADAAKRPAPFKKPSPKRPPPTSPTFKE